MVSERKRQANRANALKSTGPRTAEGKARSSRNGSWHGLAGREVVLTDRERAGYGRKMGALEREYRPGDEEERRLVEEAALAETVLERIETIDWAAWSEAGREGRDSIDPKVMRFVIRYHPRWRNALFRALDGLESLRARRAQNSRSPNLSARRSPRPIDSPKPPPTTPRSGIDARRRAKPTRVLRRSRIYSPKPPRPPSRPGKRSPKPPRFGIKSFPRNDLRSNSRPAGGWPRRSGWRS